MCSIPKCHKPTEANISSMSSWRSQPVAWEDVASFVVRVLWSSPDSPDTDNSVLSLCLFSSFFFTPVEDLNRLLSVCKRVVRRACLLVAAEGRQVVGTEPWGDEAQQASCLKVRNLLWTLGTRTHLQKYAQLILGATALQNTKVCSFTSTTPHSGQFIRYTCTV